MIAVAVAGVVLGGWAMWRRARRFAEMPRVHEDRAAVTSRGLLAERYEATAARYRHAARYPWLPVPPDPPPPE